MKGETNLLVNRMGNNSMCQLPSSRTFIFSEPLVTLPHTPPLVILD